MMGRTLQLLSEGKLESKTIFDKRIVVECCETFHLHWRNLRLEFSHENYLLFVKTVLEAYNFWNKQGAPEKAHHLEIGRGLVFPTICSPSELKMERCENLYKKHQNSRDSEFLIEDDFIHIHYRDLRIEMSRDEFVNLADNFIRAKECLDFTPAYNLSELFDVLDRNNIIYTVLRNWDNLPDYVQLGPHSDLDLLVHPLHHEKIKNLWKLTPTHRESYRVQYKCPVRNGDENSYIMCDLRTTNDGYYPEEFSNRLLNNRIPFRNFYILPPDLHMLALIYHVVYHKSVVAADYAERIIRLSRISGIEFDRHQCFNLSYLIRVLEQHNVHYVNPIDISVLPQMQLLDRFENVIYSKVLTEINGKKIMSRVYKSDNSIMKQAIGNLAEREFLILSKLSGKLFPEAYELRDTGNFSSFAMEFVEGYSLSEISRRINEWDAEKVNRFIIECIRILEELSTSGIMHRDIKPNNIIVRDFRPVLIDFGWAQLADEQPILPGGLGDWARPADGSFSDTYSMGVTLLELVSFFPQFYPAIMKMIDNHTKNGSALSFTQLKNAVSECADNVARDYKYEIHKLGVSLKIPFFIKRNYHGGDTPEFNSSLFISEAEKYIESGELTNAKILLFEVLNEEQFNRDAMNNLSVVYILENNFTDALYLIKAILKKYPSDEVAEGNLLYLTNLIQTTQADKTKAVSDKDEPNTFLVGINAGDNIV